ncbi:hypothetical protein J3B02_001459 [Coemansia erecta]|uniref:Alpha-ketoglutarate-dependent dioxygenase AlkB-like domain-containing protein n=1 Tax=Coemansia asiatica TaxID=1052880 RepID=A0A9W8CIM7_9FUNG|nr:hypothetical protein LPJ64_002964 [Coemansia asiatica]KAJ2856693.1 hypothetical protein J3B02_001459 [Coemansia erecta]KAJ2882441.1 hypothetical protein FB639_002389 [Coemansia asiatica]
MDYETSIDSDEYEQLFEDTSCNGATDTDKNKDDSDLDFLLDSVSLARKRLEKAILQQHLLWQTESSIHSTKIDRIQKVPGLVVCRGALSPELSKLYFEWLEAAYFQHTSHDPLINNNMERVNQGMYFGAMDDRSSPLGYLAYICTSIPGLLPAKLQNRVYGQGIINLYDSGEGIGDHIDLLRFDDGICGFSFGSTALMRMMPAKDVERASRYAEEIDGLGECVEVELGMGDLYAFSGDARYRWTHGFPRHIDGKDNVCGRRISVTLRKLSTW